MNRNDFRENEMINTIQISWKKAVEFHLQRKYIIIFKCEARVHSLHELSKLS